MCVKLFGREVPARVEREHSRVLVRCSEPQAFRLKAGDVVEVDDARFEVRLVTQYPGGEPDVWAFLTPLR